MDKIFDILKSWLEKPGTILKQCIVFVKLSLGVIVASHLYQRSFGDYHIIGLTDPYQWIEYVMSGRAAICLFLFALCYGFLFSIGPTLCFWPLERLFSWRIQLKRPTPKEGKTILWILKVLKIVRYDKPCRKIVAGENIDLFSELIVYFSEDTETSFVHEFKDTLLNQAWKLCFSFGVVYLFYLNHSWAIDISLVMALFFIPVYYVLLSKLHGVVIMQKSNLLRDIENLKTMERICIGFMNAGTPIEFDPPSLPPAEYVTIGGRKHLLKLHLTPFAPNVFLIRSFISEGQKKNMPVLLLMNQDLTDDGAQISADNIQEIFIVKITDENNLRNILWNKALEIKKERMAQPYSGQISQ
jgi:hypothetical protein